MKIDYTISDDDVACPMTLDSEIIRLMRIFAVVLKIYVKFSLDLMPASLYYVYRKQHAIFVIKFNCFVYDSYLPIWLPRVVKCVTSGDVASGVAKCAP